MGQRLGAGGSTLLWRILTLAPLPCNATIVSWLADFFAGMDANNIGRYSSGCLEAKGLRTLIVYDDYVIMVAYGSDMFVMMM